MKQIYKFYILIIIIVLIDIGNKSLAFENESIRLNLIELSEKVLNQTLSENELMIEIDQTKGQKQFHLSEVEYLGKLALKLDSNKIKKYPQFVKHYRCYSEVWTKSKECTGEVTSDIFTSNQSIENSPVESTLQNSLSKFQLKNNLEEKNNFFETKKEVTYFLVFLMTAFGYQALKNKQVLITF